MTRYAAATEVSVDRSRSEIERNLRRYGATGFIYGVDDEQAVALIGFKLDGWAYRVRIPLPSPNDPRLRASGSNQYHRAGEKIPGVYEQLVRQRWRAASLFILATLEAVEAGITTLQQAFLANIMLPDGRTTVGDEVGPAVAEAHRTGRMPDLLPGLTRPALPSGER